MRTYRFDMWSDDHKLLLRDVLNRIRFKRAISWVLLYFHGTGSAPNGKGMVDFEEEVRRTAKGYALDQETLDELCRGLTDIYDLKLVGLVSGLKVAEIEAIDSSLWEVRLDDRFATFAPPLKAAKPL